MNGELRKYIGQSHGKNIEVFDKNRKRSKNIEKHQIFVV